MVYFTEANVVSANKRLKLNLSSGPDRPYLPPALLKQLKYFTIGLLS